MHMRTRISEKIRTVLIGEEHIGTDLGTVTPP